MTLAAPALLPRLLTVEEVAAHLGLSRAQVYLIKHEIGYVQLGRSIRFDPDLVRAYIDTKRRGEPAKIRAINVRDL